MSTVNKKQLYLSEKSSEEFEERAIDSDIILPDYCPDIAVVLKCTVQPAISSHFQSGDRYTVDGNTCVRVLYLSEDRDELHCHESVLPFSVTFRCDRAVHHYVNVKTDYVNCRATGPRRLDIHGAIRVYLRAFDVAEVGVFSDPCRKDLFCLSKKTDLTVPMCEVNKSFCVNDSVDFNDKAEKLLYTDVLVQECEQRKLTNKLIVKGMLRVKGVYKKDSCLEKLCKEIPFSQIVDIDGLNEQCLVKTETVVCENECYLQDSESGQSRMMINVKLMLHICCSRNATSDVVLDAYSCTHPVICETEMITFVKEGEEEALCTWVEEETDLPLGVVDVVDLWGEFKTASIKDDDTSTSQCGLIVGMIAKDDTGHLGYYERIIDCAIPGGKDNTIKSVRLIDITHAVVGRQLRIKGKIEVLHDKCCYHTCAVVIDIAEETSNSYNNNSAAIRLVHADQGDSLWEIAKKHHSSVEKIKHENDLICDEMNEASMLIVPIV